ncbi:hypothetical protein K2Q16_00245 [Patescibacteria group bacterium]|nr:hypothetical protein [Patescibacteria group bacterium]
METVTIDEVEYVKASVLAKRHNYTTDYIGQLCRARKVDAHLVGRTWYVFPASLDGHKSTRYAELRSAEKTEKETNEITSSRRTVNSPLAKNTLKSQTPHFQDRVFWKKPKYQEDSSDLLPGISKENPPIQKMRIELAESERVQVASRSKNVTMISQPMPAVALAGTLKVLDYAPTFDQVSDAVVDDKKIQKSTYIERTDATVHPALVDDRHAVTAPHFEKALKSGVVKHTPIPRNATYPVAVKKIKTDTPARVHKPVIAIPQRQSGVAFGATKQSSPAPAREDKASSLFFRLVIAPAVIVLTVAVASALLVLESVTSIGSSGEELVSWQFNAAAVHDFFAPK